MQWKHASSPNPRKFKVQASAGKITCTIFRDAEGILLIDFMHQKVTITGIYYADLLYKLLLAIKEKLRGKLTQVPVLWHDNAPGFSTDDELKYATEEWLKVQSELFYFTGIEKLRQRYKLCIDKGGDYVEK